AHATVARQLDRRDRRIAVNAGGYLEGVARKVFPAARIIALSDNDAVRMAMLDRWTDAVVTDNLEEKQWTKGVVGVVRIGPLSDDRKAYLVRSDREELAAELDLWLLAHERDGSLARLRKELLGETDLTPVAAPLPALINTIDERMAIMPLVWAAKRKAQSPIEDKAQEARVLRAAAVAVSQAARAASRPVPDAEQTRALFEALMDAGKDTQRAAATSAASDSPPTTIPEFDLETRIRPALGRITAKLASLLVALAALEVPLTAEAVQRPLATALADYRLRAANVEAMSSAIAALSATDTAHAPR
ncbi:MAG: chorismate mutase, partial [Deltaproteobacteria bacterium]|nr:chorismate mutase [Deltaproteobacteria bacterium]